MSTAHDPAAAPDLSHIAPREKAEILSQALPYIRRFTDSRWAFAVLDASGDEVQPASVRIGLSRAVQGGVVPIDVLLTAGQLGLTAMQTELIAYLILGLSNMEIAEAMSISEATVRWRLTRLYRVLDVRGRKAAAARARELGLDALQVLVPPDHVGHPQAGTLPAIVVTRLPGGATHFVLAWRRLGRWLQPGGHLDPGERPDENYVRFVALDSHTGQLVASYTPPGYTSAYTGMVFDPINELVYVGSAPWNQPTDNTTPGQIIALGETDPTDQIRTCACAICDLYLSTWRRTPDTTLWPVPVPDV